MGKEEVVSRWLMRRVGVEVETRSSFFFRHKNESVLLRTTTFSVSVSGFRVRGRSDVPSASCVLDRVWVCSSWCSVWHIPPPSPWSLLSPRRPRTRRGLARPSRAGPNDPRQRDAAIWQALFFGNGTLPCSCPYAGLTSANASNQNLASC